MGRIIRTLYKLKDIEIEYDKLANYMHEKKYLLDKCYLEPLGWDRFIFKNFETDERICIKFCSTPRGIIIIDVNEAEPIENTWVQNGIL